MNNKLHLHALAESYLKNLIAEQCQLDPTSLDVAMPFTELGIDSFYILKLVKQMEVVFGNLPKTLLFEYFNVTDLAGYFVEYHSDKLALVVAGESHASDGDTSPQSVVQTIENPPLVAESSQSVAQSSATLALEQDAMAESGLGQILAELFEQYKNEGSVSRGTRNIAPNVFIGSAKKGYFNYGRCNNILMAYAYTGPQDYFDELADELLQHCLSHGLELNILTDEALKPINGQGFTSTPFGVVQRVLDIAKFTLEGSAMRRLRYQVSKFEKVGAAKTVEYQCGTQAATDQAIAAIMDQWCAARTMVNPLIYIVKDEILKGQLNAQHRLFLTYLGDDLQNVILISKMVSPANGQNGYLMDLEFYPNEMPLGGLEFAIVNIIKALAAEGCNLLSLGGTYGCKLENASSEYADPRLNKVLGTLREQNVFNDAGNLQFKNKFRPENKTIYLCRAQGHSDPDNIIDIIMMIADPAKHQTDDSEHHNLHGEPTKAPITAAANTHTQAVSQTQIAKTTVAQNTAEQNLQQPNLPRAKILCEHGFNPQNLPDDSITFDGKTDSWAQLKLAAIDQRLSLLHGSLQNTTDGNAKAEIQLKRIFGFEYFVLTQSGRSAENIFYQAWAKKGKVLENLLFPTAVYHQIDKGFNPIEVPCADAFDYSASTPFKGNLNLDTLRANLSGAAMVCIELINNASGGAPVSLAHLKAVKALLQDAKVPLVLDITRIVENALFIQQHEAACQSLTVWQIIQQICAVADALTCSLAKDFCVPFGGFVATNDSALYQQLQTLNDKAGSSLDVLDKKLLGQALVADDYIERQVSKRKTAVGQLQQQLAAAGLPVMQPAGGHCIVFDAKAVAPFATFANPAASMVAWLYLQTGIRAGIHSVGMQKGTSLNDTVRLAIAVGTKPPQIEALAAPLISAFAKLQNIPELVAQGEGAESLGDIHAPYRLLGYHNISAEVIHFGSTPVQANGIAKTPVSTNEQRLAANRKDTDGALDIAIVGVAGRYPKARDLPTLWQNLLAGHDAVDEISAERLALRRSNRFSQSYRGGFLDEVDRFDSLFFNISPREAEILDPQERLFLEVAYEAIEDAGYYPETLAKDGQPRDIAVFVGAVWAMYQMVGTEAKILGNDLNPNSFLWSVANRVSFWMNLTGPSLTVDTACSSSLTALFLACEAINNGRCSGAIVGGVNLDLHQQKYDINKSGGALSVDGLCRTFGDGANGYVAGEGVGALYIKPLHQALADKDTVQAVIKAAVVNHGGRTSGYTVPNPKSQAALVKTALQQTGIDARTLGYIEAHGTGTELGDPIEIRGLSQAFEPYQVENQSCAIGSIKSNIGHLEAAAGVVGVTKVLLQMKHRQLVPSLHSAKLNQHIDFPQSPFVVQQHVEPWQGKTVDGVAYPLRAAVSSFGAGGANAHVLMEQYLSHGVAENVQQSSDSPLVFPLSARTEPQLREFAQKLKAFVTTDEITDIDNIAFTLQVGKKSFDQRLAIVAHSKNALLEKLTQFLEGRSDDSILLGNSKNAQAITRLLSEGEKSAFIDMLSAQQDPLKLAKLWIDGLLSDWQGQLAQAKATVRRVPLPTYPFADKRHWLHSDGGVAGQVSTDFVGNRAAALHPLIDANESTFERQLFKKRFSLQDFVIGEHVVTGIATMPGVAYLELARKAGELAAAMPVCRISNVLWLSPLTVTAGQSNDVWIDLQPAAQDVQFEIFSKLDDGAKRVYAQGRLSYGQLPPQQTLDINALKAQMSQVIDGKTAYPLFSQLGLQYGAGFQAIETVYRGAGQVLGQLRLPTVLQGDFAYYQLHPALLDAAMQAGVAAQLNDELGQMMVPYSLGEVSVYGPLTQACYSYITKASEPGAKVSRENIVITDEQGKVLVSILDSVGVPIGQVHDKSSNKQASITNQDEQQYQELYYHHQWLEKPLPAPNDVLQSLIIFDNNDSLYQNYCARLTALNKPTNGVVLVQVGEVFSSAGENHFSLNPQRVADFKKLFETLASKGHVIGKILYRLGHCDNAPSLSSLPQALQCGVYGLLHLCQSLIQLKLLNQAELMYLYGSEKNHSQPHFQPHNDAVNGFVKSLLLENAKARCKVVEVLDNIDAQIDAALAEFGSDSQTARYIDGKRWVRQLTRFDMTVDNRQTDMGLKQHGVYLITGGAGGLGLIFAEFLAKRCQARLVLTGRSELSQSKTEQIAALEKLGAQVLYVATDVTEVEQVEHLVQQTRARFGTINGIIHSAGVLRDSFLRNKTDAEMTAVLAPKVFATHYLDVATAEDKLDFFVTFSSLAAIGGNAGQCDYAYANHYMDAFAVARNAEVSQGQRSGLTVSLNWSLWAEGGMQIDEQTEAIFKRSLGLKPLGTAIGVNAFAKSLLLNEPHLAVVEAVAEKIEMAWGLRPATVETAALEAPTQVQAQVPDQAQVQGDPAKPAPVSAAVDGDITKQVQNKLIEITMDFLKIDRDDIDIESILMDLGFDSIGLASFANALNDIYGTELTPVVFFEYPNIQEVAKHIAQTQGDKLKAAAVTSAPVATAIKVEEQPQDRNAMPLVATKMAFNATSATINPVTANPSSSVSSVVYSGNRFVDQPIAIVGISGVMPQSPDLTAFWHNLVAEKDLVSEIPEQRWIWQDYDGDPLQEKNKSYSRWGGFVAEVDKFDPMFFGITPREAQMMDPQQRMLVECVYSAIEDSGHKVSDLSGTRTGFFVGVSAKDYVDLMAEMDLELDGYSASGTSHSILANRISFLFNLHGPSAPLDTACSSSLIALHRAIESIHTGSSHMAIVAGVQVMLTPAAHIALSSAGMLSPDGKCKTFDQGANGYVRGEGVGAVFIKPLAMAQADGDPIRAIIKATSENHGGKVSMLTAPNPNAQADLLIEAYRKAEVDPASVGLIECHGTGTSLGDPIEIKALRKAFDTLYQDAGKAIPEQPVCGLTAVKTNIGHLEPAAGMAGLLKAVMALQHNKIPALINFNKLNSYIDLRQSPFYVADKTRDWQAPLDEQGHSLPRVAGISAFGWGGANAHVVLQQYQALPQHFTAPTGARIFMLSAKAADRLAEYAQKLLHFIATAEVAPDIDALAYTLQVGRDVMNWRLAILADSIPELIEKLTQFNNSGVLQQAGDSLTADKSLVDIFVGKVSKNNEVLSFVSTDSELQTTILDQLFNGKKWSQLLDLWVKGMDIDWRRVYGDNRPQRLSLPSYPFARERYWLPAKTTATKTAKVTVAKPQVGDFIAAPSWRLAPIELEAQTSSQAGKSFARKYLFTIDMAAITSATASRLAADYQCEIVSQSSHKTLSNYMTVALACFEFVQQIFKQKAKGRVLLQILVGDTSEHSVLYGLTGLLKTAVLENPKLQAQIIALDGDSSLEQIETVLTANAQDNQHDLVRYSAQGRWVRDWQPLAAPATEPTTSLREAGVYLITGGLGGLGRVFCRYILDLAPSATVILTGRAPLDEAISNKLADLEGDQGRVHYRAMDLSVRSDVSAAISAIVEQFGGLNGIIHSAGMVRDDFIIKTSAEQFSALLTPKVLGTLNLDLASADLDLDFMVLFSSLSAVLGNIGQVGYAAANGFMDQFAHYRQNQVNIGQRKGKTLSVNWPLWAEGGMTVANANVRLLAQTTGMQPLSTTAGIKGLRLSLASEKSQTVILQGAMPRVSQFFLSSVSGTSYQAPAVSEPPAAKPQHNQAFDWLLQQVKADWQKFTNEVK